MNEGSNHLRETSRYMGKKVCLATMHQKHLAVSQPLRDILGVSLVVPDFINTDTLGTFSGEIPRKGSMKDTAIAKARMGMEALKSNLGLANEGSYGPHPSIPIMPGGVEIMVFVDDEIGVSIFEHLVVSKTNFNHEQTDGIKNLSNFLDCVKFPSHGLVVSPNKSKDTNAKIYKGINSVSALDEAISICVKNSEDGLALVQTDMRAHQNPTRMEVLKELSVKLANRLLVDCPLCQTPGFGLIKTEPGLECEACGTATALIKNEIFGCALCSYRESRIPKNGQKTAQAFDCPECNP